MLFRSAKILAGGTVSEELKGNQHKIDKNKNGKIDSQDFKMLRKEEKKECSCEKEHEGECEMKEEVEQINEYESKDGKFVHNAKAGRYGGSEKPTDPFAGVRGPGKKDIEKIEKEKKKKKPFSEMVGLYQEKGLKSLSEMFIKEEPDNEQFTKELEDAKAKDSGKKKNTEIAKGAVQAVQKEETEQLDELSKDTLKNYVRKGVERVSDTQFRAGKHWEKGNKKSADYESKETINLL